MIIITEDTFIERFKPQPNHLDRNAGFDFGQGGCLFETYGHELGFVRSVNLACVWTVVEVDGVMSILSGGHFLNRLGYLVTAVPCPADEDYEVELEPGGD